MSTAISDHQQFVVRLARQLGRGLVDPEDLAQDVIERWLRASPRLLPDTNPRAWMTVVLRNLLVDRLRHRRTRMEVPSDLSELPAHEVEAPPWWRELETTDVTHVLDRLPAAQRQTYELFALQGKSYEEISSELEISKGTVGVHVHRARARLRTLLSAHAPAAAAS